MPSEPRIVRADVPGSPYDIVVQPGLFASAGALLRRLTKATRAAIVTDSKIGPRYLPTLQSLLHAAGFETVTAIIPAGEEHKTVATISSIYDQLFSKSIERSTPVLALGGGVIGDMAGFVAATILRGVPFVQIPTTLLSMVDASVGGKTGVNHAAGKNLIGAFHQPIAVLIDPEVLKTLPPRELRSGLAECIKHDVIRDGEAFSRLEEQISLALNLDMNYLADLVAHNVAIKARVVEADPFERGERAHLNFGHTFGHAIETVSQYEYAHGECVALGMLAAARCASSMGMLDAQSVDRIARLIERTGLPVSGLALDIDQVISAMSFDKKVKSGRVRFILPDRIGHVVIRDDVPPNLLRGALESLR